MHDDFQRFCGHDEGKGRVARAVLSNHLFILKFHHPNPPLPHPQNYLLDGVGPIICPPLLNEETDALEFE
jgi:hypothetical protein